MTLSAITFSVYPYRCVVTTHEFLDDLASVSVSSCVMITVEIKYENCS